MKIVIDALGGDNAPLEMLKGGWMAAQETGVEILFTGGKGQLEKLIADNGFSHPNISVVDAPEYISNDDTIHAIKEKKNSSLVVGLNLLREGRADALISAGSTGALITGATLIAKRIRGIRRAALAPLIVTDKDPAMLIDAGANTDCPLEYYRDFAMMGSIYMERVRGVQSPKVGLVNVGTEESKGNDTLRAANELLKTLPVNYIGNLEAREIPAGAADVIVCDGFTGNVILKLMEGMGRMLNRNLKAIFMKNTRSKLAAVLASAGLRDFKKKMDYEEYGGAPLLGIDSAVIKAHGSSNAKAIAIAVRQAITFVDNRVNDEIKSYLKGDQENASC